ncbi:MAG: hypothetical protein L3J56_06720 [Bacteroidales bacterium]|nr:hypothetical protein [Bacteroidales bacterium]
MKQKLIKRLESEINATPTGKLRELLTDINILIQSSTIIESNRFDVLSFKIRSLFSCKSPLTTIEDFDDELIKLLKEFK